MRVYLDAAPVIYTVEQIPLYAAAVDARLSAHGVVRVASDLTRMECCVKPLREGNADLLKVRCTPLPEQLVNVLESHNGDFHAAPYFSES